MVKGKKQKAAKARKLNRPKKYTVYIGVRVSPELANALVAKAQKDGIENGDAYRTAFRLYTGMTTVRGKRPALKLVKGGLKKKAA